MNLSPISLSVAIVVISATATHAQDLLPGGGVSSPDRKTGYFSAEKGGIEAVELSTGKTLWASKEASRPLIAGDKTIYAQVSIPKKGNAVRVIALDMDGKKVLQSEPIVFPDWVSVEVAYGRTFASAAVLKQGELLLVWEARTHYAGGAVPPPEVEEAARKEASGIAKVNLESGKVISLGKTDRRKVAFHAPERMNVGGLTLTVIDEPSQDPTNPLQTRRRLQASDASGRVVWQRQIAAPVQLIPPA
jgi:outer membrane protein assembly factor BamB